MHAFQIKLYIHVFCLNNSIQIYLYANRQSEIGTCSKRTIIFMHYSYPLAGLFRVALIFV